MNPLCTPWAGTVSTPERGDAPPPGPVEKVTPPSYEGFVVIKVPGPVPKVHRVRHVPGQKLHHYLKPLHLARTAAYAAVYDHTYLKLGRCRLNYVPRPDSVIVMGSSNHGLATRQRTATDVAGLARNMGRVGRGLPPSVVTVKIR